MTFKNFSTPHCHVASLDSASTPEAFAKKEVELGTGTLTVTDHGTLQATRQVYDLCHGKKYKGKLTPILGLEAYFRDDRCPIFAAHDVPKTHWFEDLETGDRYWRDEEILKDKRRRSYSKLLKEDPKKAAQLRPDWGYVDFFKYGHLTIHFCDEAAFKTATRLLSGADARAEQHGSERKPIFNWRDLEELGAQNVTFGSGCLIGMVQRHVLEHDRRDLAEAYYSRLRSLVRPDNFRVEVFPHVCDRDWKSAVHVKYDDGTEDEFKPWTKLKTDKKPGGKKSKEHYEAMDLAESWLRSKEGHGCLRAVMEDKKWVERQEPKKIVAVEAREGFVMNDCRPTAPNGDVQYGCNKVVMELAAKYGDKIIISDDSHFVSPDEKIIQDIRIGGQGGSWRFANSYHRFSSNDAWQYFDKVLQIPEKQFESWIDNNNEWAQKFKGFKFQERKSLPTGFYPQDTLKHTMRLIKKHGRMLDTPEYNERLRKEINLLHYNGTVDLLPYFFIDEQVVDLYESHGLLTGPGRGSAAGLLLTYLLGITHVDPLRYGLSMDRFMTLDRVQSGKLPDIDQDLPSRDLLVDPQNGWLKKRFGNCYAQISVDTTLKLRSAVKDVARWKRTRPNENGQIVRGQVPADIEALTRKFIEAPQGISDADFVFGYKKEGEEVWVEGSMTYDPALQEYISKFSDEWEHVQKCLGLSRQKGRHACAYVIADEAISNFIPLTSVSGVTVTQFTAPSVEASGGLKMDFLVVNSLNDIGNAIRLIQDHHGGPEFNWQGARQGTSIEVPGAPGMPVPSMRIDYKLVPLIRSVPFRGRYFDIWDLPEDQQVFRDICEGKTETVFQFNTPGAKKWLRCFDAVRFTDAQGQDHKALDSIEALAAFTALDRPGPLDYYVDIPGGGKHNMLVEYAKRAKGEGHVGGLPILDKLFPETYGVIVYQEQLQRAFQEIGGTTGIEANNFRNNIAKKKMKEVQGDRALFMKGAIPTLGTEVAEQLWKSMETFGQYGFNKSHAICYVIIGYACAWLKRHYPLEWWTAVLCNADKKEIDEVFWPYCGHLIKTPDINKSGPNFQIDGDGIRAPLSLLQGVGPAAQKELDVGRPFKDIQDFCNKKVACKSVKTRGADGKEKTGRSALHDGIVYKLICSGVMDSLFSEGHEAPEKLYMYEEAHAVAAHKKRAEKVDPRYSDLKPLQRYQLKKSILTAYGEDFRELLIDAQVQNLQKTARGYDYFHRPQYGDAERVGLVDSRGSEALHHMPLPPGGIRWATAAYVISDDRVTYHGSKKMMKLLLDVEGERRELIKWPDKEGKLPKKFSGSLTGSLVIAIISRFNEAKPAVLDDVIVVQEPLSFKEGEKDDDKPKT